MAKNVIILGAGASREYGAPVMKNFLDVAARLHAAGKSGKHSDSFKRVFEAISRLQAVHSKSEFDLVNIESIFTGFELAKTLKKFPGIEAEQIDQLIDDLKWVIVSTLQETIRFPVEGQHICGHPPIESFVKGLISKRENNKINSAILTFNYDILFDVAMMRHVGVDYGIQRQPNAIDWLPLLKLHGSLNWATNTETGDVVPWFLSKYFTRYSLDYYFNGSEAGVPIGDQLSDYGKGQNEPEKLDGIPVIVPPSWNKADSHRAISKVWSRAAEELTEAQSIFIIGYSLPETDSFFRQLYALGTVGEALLERFWVFNPDKTREPIFRAILGPGARERYSFFEMKFSEATEKIIEAINA